MTWFLHSYQWFWLRGSVLFEWQDILFWTVLGVLVVINSLWEANGGREDPSVSRVGPFAARQS